MKQIRLAVKLVISYTLANKKLFLFGVILSILGIVFLPRVLPVLLAPRPEIIGLAGNFTVSDLPKELQEKISYGLVGIGPDGVATPAAARSWQATDSGRTFIFQLNPDIVWQDGVKLLADQVNYNLKGVEVFRPNPAEIVFKLKEPFAPLPAFLAQPLFKNGLIGLGNFRVLDVKFTGRFLSSLQLQDQTSGRRVVYKFYPSEASVISALRIGAITEATGLHRTYGLESDPYFQYSSQVSGNTLATIFLNTQKKPLDDKTTRQALTYALPDIFDEGEAAETPMPKNSWAKGNLAKIYAQNGSLAKSLINKSYPASASAKPKLVLTTNRDLESVANKVAASWSEVGIATQVEVTDVSPVNFDAYLTYLDLPADPDQYAIWHSTQNGNISGYKSYKVDLLLEEGRRTLDPKARKEIYANFQKAITEDVPAIFLFYPKLYTISRAH
jgi:peptide/nickel transport system substrate-binding protein